MKIKELETNLILLGFEPTGEGNNEWELGDIYVGVERVDYIHTCSWNKTSDKVSRGSDAPVKALEHVVKLLGEANE